VGKAQTDFKGWFAFFSLALLTGVLALIAAFAWRVHPEPEAPDPRPEREREEPVEP
jgi:hypothetical protein